MVERILKLIEEKDTNPAAVERDLGWGNGSIKKFKTSSPSITKLQQLADKLDVTVAYLIGEDDGRAILTDDEKGLIDVYRNLNTESKQMVRERANALKDIQPVRFKTKSFNGTLQVKYSYDRLSEAVKKALNEYFEEKKHS